MFVEPATMRSSEVPADAKRERSRRVAGKTASPASAMRSKTPGINTGGNRIELGGTGAPFVEIFAVASPRQYLRRCHRAASLWDGSRVGKRHGSSEPVVATTTECTKRAASISAFRMTRIGPQVVVIVPSKRAAGGRAPRAFATHTSAFYRDLCTTAITPLDSMREVRL